MPTKFYRPTRMLLCWEPEASFLHDASNGDDVITVAVALI